MYMCCLLGNGKRGVLSLVGCLGVPDPAWVLISGWWIDLFAWWDHLFIDLNFNK